MSAFLKNIILTVIVSLITVIIYTSFSSPKPTAVITKKETAYERVIRTGVLRCGYGIWPKTFEIDPNTHKMSGTFYDYLTEIGKSMDIKIEWTQEVAFGDLPEALRSGKIDAHCAAGWTNAMRGKYADAVEPMAYQSITAYTKQRNTKFDDRYESMNSPDVKIGVIEGSSDSVIAKADFPNAKTLVLPALADSSQLMMNIADGKVDVVFVDAETAQQYIQNNPGKVQQVKSDFPVRLFGTSIWVAKGEYDLKQILDNATRQLLYTGTIDRILKKYETTPGSFIRARPPFETMPK